MRERDRLIEVMKSVNPSLYPTVAGHMWEMANCMDFRDPPQMCPVCAARMHHVATYHESHHLRDLAVNALHHMGVPV